MPMQINAIKNSVDKNGDDGHKDAESDGCPKPVEAKPLMPQS